MGVALIVAACGDDDDGGSAGGGSVEDWCGLMDLANEGDAIFEGLGTASPADVETGMNRIKEILPAVESAAPAEIADDVNFFVDYTEQLVASVEAADYNLLDVDLSFVAENEERLDEVNDNLDAFSQRECGQPFGGADDDVEADPSTGDDSGDSGDFDPNAGTIREQLVQQFVALGLTQQEAECLVDNADLDDPGLFEGDEAAILGLFEACDIPLSRLAELGG